MATLSFSGMDNLINDLEKLERSEMDAIATKMLDEGAEECVKAWDKGIRQAGHVDTGDMLRSVKATGKKNHREIYPRGRDRHGIRNAEKAFILHYGTSTILGDRFVDEINESSEYPAIKAMEDVFNNEMKKRGF